MIPAVAADRVTARRILAFVAVGALATGGGVLLASTAGADSSGNVRFTATITGTFTSTGSETDKNCARENPDGSTTKFSTAATSSEDVRFHSTRGALFIANKLPGEMLFGSGGLPVSARFTKSSTLTNDGSPPGCVPNTKPQTTCGTKAVQVHVLIQGLGTKFATIVYHVTKPNSNLPPGEPLANCQLVFNEPRWTDFSSGQARIPMSKFLRTANRTLVFHGSSGASHEHHDSELDTLVHGKVSWTLTLKRR
jgi:hypothetical protein